MGAGSARAAAGRHPFVMLRVFVNAFVEAWNDNVPRLGASLAYYTLFAFAPVVIVATAISNSIFHSDATSARLVAQISAVVGDQAGRAVQALVTSARSPRGSVVAVTTGTVAFVFAATGAFLELQAALDTIWRVKPVPGLNVTGFLKDRLRSFGVMMGVGLLLLVSLVASAALAAAGTWLSYRFPQAPWLLAALDLATSIALNVALFAMLFRYVPDVKLEWRDVLTGAIVTALLFAAGEYLIGMYLGLSAVASSYGAAGSVVLLLLWLYYSAQVFLVGAEFTRLHAAHRGIRPPCQEYAAPAPRSSSES
jgi:membrane protein